ncbi:hypothetical protein ACHAXT_002719 [Thalassiosira profunda]
MGKKKSQKRAKDARGYSTGGPPPKSSSAVPSAKAPGMSARAHDGVKDLLGRLGGSTGDAGKAASTKHAPPSDRFATRLSNAVDRLDELGFTNSHVEQVVKALGYEITVEGALDWLCLHLPTLELPALFTDGVVRQDLTEVTTAESLTVVREAGPGGGDMALADNVLAVDAAAIDKLEGILDDDEEGKRKEKERLLLQYQYEEDEECDRGEMEAVPTPDVATDATIELTPEERELAAQEAALAELEADANNDANNYMRSKAEIKQLRNEVKKMKQMVAGLRRKVERNRAHRQKKEPDEAEGSSDGVANGAENSAAKEEEPEAEESGGCFDIFALSKEDVGGDDEAATEEEAPSQPKTILDLAYDAKKWTGSTPQLKLETVLKKQKLPRARYNKLPANGGFVLAVTLDKEKPPQKWEARSVDFRDGSSLKDYLAMQCLYAIDPTLPLYQIFPPPFRDLWRSWMDQVKQEKDEARQQEDEARQERMEHLLSLISQMQVGQSTDDVANGKGAREEHEDAAFDQADETVADNWDDDSDSDDDLPVTTSAAAPSQKGKKMQADFVRRQATSSYQKMKAARDDLPMASYRSAVLKAVENNAVTILCAETGAGKSTQCAQYILEQALLDGRGDEVNLICTQPRRVAATSLAERVADEMCDSLGRTVGYQIRMESKRSPQTKLLFCTTGVILRRLQDDPNLSDITHVFVDEVHERQQQIDVLLVILRRLLQTTRPDLKVVLMSATMETELFSSFFRGAPVINVPGRTFPVSSYHLEDLLDATGHIIEAGSRYAFREDYRGDTASLWVTTRGGEKRKETVDLTSQTQPGEVSDLYAGYSMSTRRSMERVNEEVVNFDLIEDVLKLVTEKEGEHALVAPDEVDMSRGSVLIFLPGLGEIKALMERLDGSRLFRDRTRFDVIPLHSTLSSRDQRRAFLPSKAGCRKIICATNIAETSVTIPDVVCCIDSGRVREVRRNKRTSASMLVTDWCPKSSAKQRQGRAGRVQPGICLKLYSSFTAERVMKATNEPELRRVPLEEVLMTILSSGFAHSCKEFLDQAPQPPSDESVQSALNVLFDVGAIEVTQRTSERLTPLGKHLAKLPVDVKVGKMLIYGCIFRCIDPILTIAASLSASKSPFAMVFDDAGVAKARQRAFADPDSDFLTYCNVWEAYQKATEASVSAGRRFCRDNYLNHIALREIEDARRQFFTLLCGIGFLDGKIRFEEVRSCRFNRNAKRTEVVHSVTCAGLYPNVARLEQTGQTDYALWHNKERIYFHKSSVNASKKRFSDSERWLVFHEKFGTPQRTSVSTTAIIHPFALLLFGGTVVVRHTERTVIVDQNSIGMAAQTGVMLRELRKKIDLLLQRMIECADVDEIERLDARIIDGVINIIAS